MQHSKCAQSVFSSLFFNSVATNQADMFRMITFHSTRSNFDQAAMQLAKCLTSVKALKKAYKHCYALCHLTPVEGSDRAPRRRVF